MEMSEELRMIIIAIIIIIATVIITIMLLHDRKEDLKTPKYESYEDGFEHENLKNLILKNKELEARTKLEESLNTLATFAIIGISIITAIVILLAISVIRS